MWNAYKNASKKADMRDIYKMFYGGGNEGKERGKMNECEYLAVLSAAETEMLQIERRPGFREFRDWK